MCTKLKALLMAIILVGFAAQHAAAENLNQEDMAFAFGDSAAVTSDFGQLELLSSQEMMATEGEMLPLMFSIFALDFSLIGTYWGVYLPYLERQGRRYEIQMNQ